MQAEQRTAEALAAARKLHADLTICLPQLGAGVTLNRATNISGMLLTFRLLGEPLDSQSFSCTHLAQLIQSARWTTD